MSDTPAKKQMDRAKARIEAAVLKWKPLMGLGIWRVNMAWYRDWKDVPKAHRKSKTSPGAHMWMDVRWEYLLATLNVYLPESAYWSKSRLREAVRHELAHALVGEMRAWHFSLGDAMMHEERVVSTLACAFQWAYVAGWNEGRADLRKKAKP